MKTPSNRIEKFFQKALDVMFRSVGFDGFDEEFSKKSDWYARREWTPQQKDDFRNWFISSSRKDLKWSKQLADKEFALFDLIWGWREKRR